MFTDWYCPQCSSLARTVDSKIPMHPCRGIKGLMAPLIPIGTKGESKSVERQDYIGKETVQRDSDGRPVMAVLTTRDEGQDCTVFAPCASLSVQGEDT